MSRSFLSMFVTALSAISLCCTPYTSGLQRTSSQVDETSAVSNLRTIGQAETAYSVSNGGDYGTFEQLVAGGYLDTRFSSNPPKLRGFVFTLKPSKTSGESSYTCNADPDVTKFDGGRHFYLDSTSPLIRVNPTRPATASDQLLQP